MDIVIQDFAKRAYLSYAMSVVTDRALPSIEDGQKPVQRRILYAMKELDNGHGAPHKKSARIVGDVIGKYHPHGDASVYEATVRMAQDFTMRYPLIDGQGNFGSKDGDGAAAMRYTEIRLTRLAEEILLSEIKNGTVNFHDNYDGTLKEPCLLPSKLPILLLNGATGIAVGMATNIPSHNLNEIAQATIKVVLDPQASDSDILAFVAGPDFPGGGQIISSKEEIQQIYSNGRGSLRVRARWTVEALARGQWRVAITELPPETNTTKVLSEIEEIINPKVKPGKKTLTQEQQALRSTALSLIDSVRDDSDQEHPVRILIEPKSRNVPVDDLMNFLLANTSLEGNYTVNMTVLGRNKRPVQMGLPTILREWTDFRLMTVERRIRNRLNEVERRIHILDGRLIATLHIDEIIEVIRNEDDPGQVLMNRFGLSELQTEDILEMRIRQLSKLEDIKIKAERDTLSKERDKLSCLIESESERRLLVASEIRSDMERFGDARRTLIEAANKAQPSKIETVIDEPVTLLYSKNGFIRVRQGHGLDKSNIVWKDGDGEFAVIETRTTWPAVILDSEGRTYTLRVADLPMGKGDGVPISSLVDVTPKKVVAILSARPNEHVLVASTSGYGFVCNLSDMLGRQKSGKSFMNLDGADILPPVLLHDTDTEIAAQTNDGRLLVMPLEEIRNLSGGKGVQLIGLNDNEKMVSVQAVRCPITVSMMSNDGKLRNLTLDENQLDGYRGHRARRGRKLY